MKRKQNKGCPHCPHYSYAHGPGKPCKGLDAAGDECDCEHPFNPEPVKKAKSVPGSNPGRVAGAREPDLGKSAAGAPTSQLSTYNWLSAKFSKIDQALTKTELQSDLDGIVAEVSKTLDTIFESNKRIFGETVTIMQEQCAAAICPLCHDATPRKEVNGREVHIVKEGTTVRCPANAIWSMGARLRGLRPTPYGIFVDKIFNLPKVGSPENG